MIAAGIGVAIFLTFVGCCLIATAWRAWSPEVRRSNSIAGIVAIGIALAALVLPEVLS